jgi:hypothetical protein
VTREEGTWKNGESRKVVTRTRKFESSSGGFRGAEGRPPTGQCFS